MYSIEDLNDSLLLKILWQLPSQDRASFFRLSPGINKQFKNVKEVFDELDELDSLAFAEKCEHIFAHKYIPNPGEVVNAMKIKRKLTLSSQKNQQVFNGHNVQVFWRLLVAMAWFYDS